MVKPRESAGRSLSKVILGHFECSEDAKSLIFESIRKWPVLLWNAGRRRKTMSVYLNFERTFTILMIVERQKYEAFTVFWMPRKTRRSVPLPQIFPSACSSWSATSESWRRINTSVLVYPLFASASLTGFAHSSYSFEDICSFAPAKAKGDNDSEFSRLRC